MKTSQNPAQPEFDGAKIEAIQRAIQQGTFKPDANRIADRLLTNGDWRRLQQSH